jgi:uncharacterized damage-inducible protein DinB
MNLYGSRELVSSIRTVRKNTILIAEDIPETEYGFRPTPDSRSVADILIHIASLSQMDQLLHGNDRVASLEGFDFGSLTKRTEIGEMRPQSKSEILDALRTEGERWSQWIEGLPEARLTEQVRFPGGILKTRFEMLLGTKEHEMHHRAQLTVIERLLGIEPHLTRNRKRVPEKAASSIKV